MQSADELTLLFLGQALPLASVAVANSVTSWILMGAGAAIALVASTFWKTAGKLEGLRWWTTRISLERYKQLPEEVRIDPLEAMYYGVDAVRDRRRRETSLIRLGLGLTLALAFSGAFQLSEVGTNTSGWNAWLFVGEVLVLPFCVYYFAVLAYACFKHGLPDKEDRPAVEKQLAELRANRHAGSVAGELVVRRISSPEIIVDRSPEPYRAIVHDRIRACHQRFDPTLFKHEQECVESLQNALNALKRDTENRHRYDLLAVCMDKTLGAYYVDEYLKLNCEAARAGLYISRIFVTDPSDLNGVNRIESIAAEQSRAGIHAYLIERSKLQEYMRESYKSDIFGFTVIRGVESKERVMLHAGVGSDVRAAAYEEPTLAEHFAKIHRSIRARAVRSRGERPMRQYDQARTKVVLDINGEKLAGVRLNYGYANGRPAPMSLAVRCKWSLERFSPGSVVGVSAPALKPDRFEMQITHAHKFDHALCKRREHAVCFQARAGDCIIGLC